MRSFRRTRQTCCFADLRCAQQLTVYAGTKRGEGEGLTSERTLDQGAAVIVEWRAATWNRSGRCMASCQTSIRRSSGKSASRGSTRIMVALLALPLARRGILASLR